MPLLERPDAQIWWESRGTGSPLLVLQGLGDPSDATWRLMPALTARHTVLLVDNRAVGRSSIPHRDFTIDDMARDAAAVVEQAGLGPAHVIGFSMGGLIAQELALRHPELVRSLTLACTSPGGRDATPMSRRVAHIFNDPHTLTSPARAAVMYAAATSAMAIHADAHMRLSRPTTHLGYAKQLLAVARYGGCLRRLHHLSCPTLIVHGTKDLIVPVHNADLLHARVPHAQICKVRGAGHMLTTDATDELLNRLLTFAASSDTPVAPGRATALPGRAG